MKTNEIVADALATAEATEVISYENYGLEVATKFIQVLSEAGFAIVPREPTEGMVDAAINNAHPATLDVTQLGWDRKACASDYKEMIKTWEGRE